MEVWAVASVAWTPGDEHDSCFPRPEGPQKVSASKVPAPGAAPFPRPGTQEGTSPHDLPTVSFEPQKVGLRGNQRGPHRASESPRLL